MNPEPKSIREMTERLRLYWWPNLTPDNYHITSDETKAYNCVAWVENITHRPIDFSLDEDGEPLPYPDLTPKLYIEHFQRNGFELCETPDLVDGFEKIALYIHEDGTFLHVALQLANGHWTSKLGEYEDIEHYTLEALEKPSYYGKARIFLQRLRINQ